MLPAANVAFWRRGSGPLHVRTLFARRRVAGSRTGARYLPRLSSSSSSGCSMGLRLRLSGSISLADTVIVHAGN